MSARFLFDSIWGRKNFFDLGSVKRINGLGRTPVRMNLFLKIIVVFYKITTIMIYVIQNPLSKLKKEMELNTPIPNTVEGDDQLTDNTKPVIQEVENYYELNCTNLYQAQEYYEFNN